MNHILLTGATGFLGSHLLESLIYNGYQVTILKRSTSDTWRISHLLNKIKTHNIDKERIEEIFKNNDINLIIHLATFYKKNDEINFFEDMIDVNIKLPSLLLEHGIRFGIKGFINTGTFFEYDDSTVPISEKNSNKPSNYYARTKISFESILHTYNNLINIVTLKIFSPYGPKDNKKIIPYILESAIKKTPLKLSAGLQKLDFIYCDDVVNAYIKTIEYIVKKEKINETFNIGSGLPISIRELISIIEEKSGMNIEKEWGNSTSNSFLITFADIAKAKEQLNWHPKVSIKEGITKTMSYYGF
ncbi:NAD-dependent epimerase/dehydratase family protein [Vreelandella salicampi]|uniref:NAD(P)-dependent oxidoreductase n=1 Tax=Vreelandella salicampi TaxID=1449798 RepID=A0A7Z0RTK9_9GAMM|nr:NAD(P)-dependent oxidoreductase [Halomonas salicampi]NYS59721.1 NAD(P)-dependent oxidoreductase [Halomonas salicampi]